MAFIHRHQPALITEQRLAVAAFLKADVEGLAFVRNATTAVAVVLHSLDLKPGDELVTTTHRYQAVANALRHFAGRVGASVVEVPIPLPLAGPDTVVDAVAAAITPRTRLVMVDWITSPTAVVFPAAALVGHCRAAGVPIMVDGAHTPGHLDVDLTALGADFYTGNLHKWLCAPKGTAVLHASPLWRDQLHHPVVSHGYGQGLQAELEWTGTDDLSGWLCSAAAIERHQALGGSDFRAANHALALLGRDQVASRLDLQPPVPDDMVGAMASLPLPAALDDRERLLGALQAARIEVPIHPCDQRLWLRLSAFSSYNHADQYSHLAETLARIL